MKHPHIEFIRACLIDPSREIQYRTSDDEPWMDEKTPTWRTDWYYRLKPESKTDDKETKVKN